MQPTCPAPRSPLLAASRYLSRPGRSSSLSASRGTAPSRCLCSAERSACCERTFQSCPNDSSPGACHDLVDHHHPHLLVRPRRCAAPSPRCPERSTSRCRRVAPRRQHRGRARAAGRRRAAGAPRRPASRTRCLRTHGRPEGSRQGRREGTALRDAVLQWQHEKFIAYLVIRFGIDRRPMQGSPFLRSDLCDGTAVDLPAGKSVEGVPCLPTARIWRRNNSLQTLRRNGGFTVAPHGYSVIPVSAAGLVLVPTMVAVLPVPAMPLGTSPRPLVFKGGCIRGWAWARPVHLSGGGKLRRLYVHGPRLDVNRARLNVHGLRLHIDRRRLYVDGRTLQGDREVDVASRLRSGGSAESRNCECGCCDEFCGDGRIHDGSLSWHESHLARPSMNGI